MEKPSKIDFKYNLKLYWQFLRKYKLIVFTLLGMILIIEASYVLDKFLFKIIIDNGTLFSSGELARAAFVSSLLLVMGIYISAFLVRTVLKFFHIHLINRLDSNLIFDIKRKFFNHVLHLDYSFHTTHKTGALISRLVRSGSAVERMTDVIIFNTAPLILQLVVVFFSLAYFSWISGAIVLVTITSFIGWSFFMQRKQEPHNVEANRVEDFEKANVADIFTNIDSVKYFGKEKRIRSIFKKMILRTRKKALIAWYHFRWIDSMQTFILSLGTLLLFIYPLHQFLNGEITIGTVVFIYTTFTTLMGPLFGFVFGIRGFYRAMADLEVLFQYNKIEKDIKDKPNAKKLKIKNGEIEFKDVIFNYGKRKLFENFDLEIKPNEKVALVGPSGCGKTSLIKLLYRLYDVKGGKILIDGKDIRNFEQESLRSEMSIVPQEAVLFDDTIYNNIKFSNPTASKQKVMEAIKFAQLDKIIENFPKKEKTIVGERGVRLSGGEKQRVSIARAILANKKILVLDEATSALDSETEYEIQKDLDKLLEGRTSIIIAHRLSTIMKADKIVVLDKGKIVQMGTHHDLINQKGMYQRLWNLQKGGYIK